MQFRSYQYFIQFLFFRLFAVNAILASGVSCLARNDTAEVESVIVEKWRGSELTDDARRQITGKTMIIALGEYSHGDPLVESTQESVAV